MRWRANPDEETTDWGAVCGRTARKVRREGRAEALSYPYQRVFQYFPSPLGSFRVRAMNPVSRTSSPQHPAPHAHLVQMY